MSQNDFRSWYRRRLDFYTNFHHINTTDETYKREQLALQIDAALARVSEFRCLHMSVTSFFVAASFAAPDTLWTNEYFWTYSSNNPDKTSLAGRSIGSRFHSVTVCVIGSGGFSRLLTRSWFLHTLVPPGQVHWWPLSARCWANTINRTRSRSREEDR